LEGYQKEIRKEKGPPLQIKDNDQWAHCQGRPLREISYNPLEFLLFWEATVVKFYIHVGWIDVFRFPLGGLSGLNLSPC
jgi:hypothetical protein